LYFAVARGAQTGCGCSGHAGVSDKKDVVAAEMTKWFDTNYHYIVPEFEKEQRFHLTSTKPVDEYLEAKALGYETRPVLVGPLTYLLLGKTKDGGDALALLDQLLPVYEELIKKLSAAEAKWIQLDEPFLALNLDDRTRALYLSAYKRLVQAAGSTKLFVTTYFESLRENLDTALSLPVAALHIDLVRGRDQLDDVLAKFPADKILSLGVVNGRNIWRNDLSESLTLVEKAVAKLGPDRIWVAPSCSLLFTPYDLAYETDLDDTLKSWLAFSKQKLGEVTALATGANKGRAAIAEVLSSSDAAQASRRSSRRIHNDAVKARIAAISTADMTRKSPYKTRKALQQNVFKLPAFPTTTIGSFPQTQDVRWCTTACSTGPGPAMSSRSCCPPNAWRNASSSRGS
jgi:5-methyltetrahydropteroyltriglutamate--homocysteine methyltransferase